MYIKLQFQVSLPCAQPCSGSLLLSAKCCSAPAIWVPEGSSFCHTCCRWVLQATGAGTVSFPKHLLKSLLVSGYCGHLFSMFSMGTCIIWAFCLSQPLAWNLSVLKCHHQELPMSQGSVCVRLHGVLTSLGSDSSQEKGQVTVLRAPEMSHTVWPLCNLMLVAY